MPRPHTPGAPAAPPPPDEVFSTGHMNPAVVRIGNRIHRAASPQSPTILRLLTHVRAQGVDCVPAHHGFDAQEREVLDFIPGEVVHDAPPWQRDKQVVRTVARALRE